MASVGITSISAYDPVRSNTRFKNPAAARVPDDQSSIHRLDAAVSLQYQKSSEAAFRLEISRQLISAKISNARRALQRLTARRPSFEKPILATFSHLQRDAGYATNLETLRGIEGAAAARYFALWAGFLPAAFPFERRSAPPSSSRSLCGFSPSASLMQIISSPTARASISTISGENSFSSNTRTASNAHSSAPSPATGPLSGPCSPMPRHASNCHWRIPDVWLHSSFLETRTVPSKLCSHVFQ